MGSTIVVRPVAEYSVDLSAATEDAGKGRRFTRVTLWTWGFRGESEFRDDVERVAAELIANAFPGGPFRLTLTCDMYRRVIRISVLDHRGGQPVEQPANLDAESGRGLLIVEALADAWGYEPGDGGKTVWAEMSYEAAKA